jgi:peptide/nickel transport system permease protein
MASFVLRRILVAIPILLGVTLITFVFINLVPGDYIDTLINPDLSGANRANLAPLEHQLGLDKPAPVRYVLWLKQVAIGNLGYSLATQKPVTSEITRSLVPTLKLTVSALVFAVIIGMILGVISALHPHSLVDYVLTLLGFIWISVPSFFAAIAALYLFSIRLSIFPVAGMGPEGQAGVSLPNQLYYLLLPAGILGLERVAAFMRYTRSSMLEVMRLDYVTVARAKGLPHWRVVTNHACRNALLPLVTIIGLSLPGLIGGSVIIEAIFGWPGLGTLSINAVTQRDYPVIMGINFVAAIMVLASNLLADIAYGIVDPRIRYD